jgi:DNA-binding phage protein
MTLKFPTTPTQKLRLARIVVAMQDAKLEGQFVAAANELASSDQGAFELMELWFEATEQSDRDEAIADIQELLDEAEELPLHPAERPKLPHDQLESIALQVLAHKKKLRDLIDRHGGVSEVARRAGIPQPSLSRMLNSAAMPRRTTLYKLATAMGASDAEVVADWIR